MYVALQTVTHFSDIKEEIFKHASASLPSSLLSEDKIDFA